MVRYLHVTLHKAIKQAVAKVLIPCNVAASVKAPWRHKKEVHRSRKRRPVLSCALGKLSEKPAFSSRPILVAALPLNCGRSPTLHVLWKPAPPHAPRGA